MTTFTKPIKHSFCESLIDLLDSHRTITPRKCPHLRHDTRSPWTINLLWERHKKMCASSPSKSPVCLRHFRRWMKASNFLLKESAVDVMRQELLPHDCVFDNFIAVRRRNDACYFLQTYCVYWNGISFRSSAFDTKESSDTECSSLYLVALATDKNKTAHFLFRRVDCPPYVSRRKRQNVLLLKHLVRCIKASGTTHLVMYNIDDVHDLVKSAPSLFTRTKFLVFGGRQRSFLEDGIYLQTKDEKKSIVINQRSYPKKEARRVLHQAFSFPEEVNAIRE